MHHLIEIWFGWVRDGGYWAIILLMAMESSIIPVPSEMVIPPAAFLAAQGRLSLAGVILAGTVGSYLGSAISYLVSMWVGRPLVARYGKFFFMSEDKVARAERWLVRYEAGGIFFARLLPFIRHLISIPAGILRINFPVFSLMTVLGAAVWCAVLAYLGLELHNLQPHLMDAGHPEAFVELIKSKSKWIVVGVAALAATVFLLLKLTDKPAAAPGGTGAV